MLVEAHSIKDPCHRVVSYDIPNLTNVRKLGSVEKRRLVIGRRSAKCRRRSYGRSERLGFPRS